VIAGIDVSDADACREYVALVPGTAEPFGGRFVTRGGEHETLEGEWRPQRLVMIEFPSADHARRWHASEAYVAATATRHRASTGRLVQVEEPVRRAARPVAHIPPGPDDSGITVCARNGMREPGDPRGSDD
jgi:uncharacterized protein (DUF1330 family)